MHRGHQKLFEYLGDDGAIVVIESGYANLTPNGFRELHSPYPILYLQLEKIKNYEADAFIRLLKEHFPKLERIVVGYDFAFGKDRKYDAMYLKNVCSSEVIIVDEVKIDGVSVHSRVIRNYLQKGNIKIANRLLGYNYTISGTKITGQGIGAKELVATINLKNIHNFLLPKEGVYATFTRVDGSEHLFASVSFLGHRVSTDGSFAIESHILDQNVTCTKSASISFVEFLRPNQKFATLHELKSQISHDIQEAKKILKHLAL